MSRGRGRGRGRGAGRSPLLDALSLPKGEVLPPPILQPPPYYPHLERRAIDMKLNEEDEYTGTVKREFRQFIQNSHFYVRKTVTEDNRFMHYTEVFRKYSACSAEDENILSGWKPNWATFPPELRPIKSKKRRVCVPLQKKVKNRVNPEARDISSLERLQEEDGIQSGEEEGVEEVVEYDEEEEEEEGDYTMNYFDDGGDDYGGEEDDALEEKEGPCY